MKVLLGIWISSESKRNDAQIRTGVALAKRFPGTIRAVVVGNEVLLRGEMTAADLETLVRSVRAQAGVPVTYADVWEFWLRNRSLAAAVDFVTVHILPYWEDIPIPAEHAARHIASIHDRVAAEFPGRDVLIGEAGWPSAGRMREGARPSPADQARVLHDLLSAAAAGKFRVNLIEAYDQPWKRHLEGTAGGYWGLYDDAHRLKLVWGEPVSNHPRWPWQAAAGVAFAAAVLAFASQMRRRGRMSTFSAGGGVAITAVATIGGAMLGAVVEAAVTESLGLGGWLRSLSLVGVAAVTPFAAAAGIACRTDLCPLDEVIGPSGRRTRDGVALALGWCLIVTCIVALEAALSLTFNPRYLDFPYTALTAAVAPLAIVSMRYATPGAIRPAAEATIAALLVASAIWIVWSEGPANWQAIWLAAVLGLLAVTLARVRAAPSSV